MPEAREARYLDLEIHIGRGAANVYPVSARSDAGDARGTLTLPFDASEIDRRVSAFHQAVRAGRNLVVVDGGAPREPPRELGRKLFGALFDGTLGRFYDRAAGRAEALGRARRILLQIDAEELAPLPWEVLFDAGEGGSGQHLCLMDVPVIRYPTVSKSKESLVVARPLRILGMIAVPKDLPPLATEKEKAWIESALSELVAAGLVELAWVQGQTWEALNRALDGGWHVLHFIGHGGPGVLALEDEQGKERAFGAQQLAALVYGHPSLRLVVLNSCDGARGDARDVFSSTAATLVGHGVPAALGMQCRISDVAATHFARAFYEALACGKSLAGAVAEARKALFMLSEEVAEWATPSLYLHAPDAVMIDVEASGVADTAAAGGGVIELTRRIAETPDRAELYLARGKLYLATRKDLAASDFRRAAALSASAASSAAAAEVLAQQKAAAVLLAAELTNQRTSDAASTLRSAYEAAERRLSGVSILWVDDHPEKLGWEIKAFQALGARVETCADNDQARAKLQASRYSVVITDVARDTPTGVDWSAGDRLIDEVRRRGAGKTPDLTPIVVYSMPKAKTREELETKVKDRRAKYTSMGADGYEVYSDKLLATVAAAVRGRAVLAQFFGIEVVMSTLASPDGAPRFEAVCPDGAASYRVAPLALLKGALPDRERRLVEAWAELRREELVSRWEDLRNGRPAEAIPPLV